MRRLSTNLTKKVAILFALTFMILIVITLLVTYLGFKEQVDDQMRHTNTVLLQQVEQRVEMMLREQDKSVMHLMREYEIKRVMEGKFENANDQQLKTIAASHKLSDFMQANDQAFSVHLHAFADPQITLSETSLTGYYNFNFAQWLNDMQNAEGLYRWLSTKALRDEESDMHRNVVTLVRSFPLLSPPGMREGIVALSVDENILYGMIKGADDKRIGQTFILDSEGVVISDGNKESLYLNLSDDPAIASIMKASGSGVIHDSQRNSSVFYAASDYLGWTFIRIVPDIQMDQASRDARDIALTMAIIALVVAIVSIFALSNWTLRPLNQLVKNVSKRGNEPIGSVEEIGELKFLEHYFNHLEQENDAKQRHLREGFPAIKRRLFMDILMGYRTDYTQIRPYLDMLGMELDVGDHIVLVAELDNLTGISSTKDRALYTYALMNVAEELILAESKGMAVELEEARVGILMSFGDSDPNNVMKALYVADMIRDYVAQHFKQTVTVGIGRLAIQLSDVKASFQEAQEAVGYKFVIGSNQVISIDDIASYDSADFLRVFAIADSLAAAIKETDLTAVNKLADKMFLEAASGKFSPDMIRHLCSQALMKMMKTVDDIGITMQDEREPAMSAVDTLRQYEDANQMKDYMLELMTGVIARIKEKRSQRGRNDVVEKVTQYIQEHYMQNDLSLNLLAELFQLSVPHLSKLFKESTESNFIDYLIHIRMTEAKRLLTGSTKKVNEIALEVGYTNSHSFIRIFKKHTGLTPTEFREQTSSR